MNAFERDAGGSGDLAILEYGDGEFTVMRPGRHVLCAVTGQAIAIESLRYWSPVLQEAYAGPAEALKRWQEVKG